MNKETTNSSSKTTQDPRLQELRGYVKQLSGLLDDPQPGLMSWCMMYGEVMGKIQDFWNKK